MGTVNMTYNGAGNKMPMGRTGTYRLLRQFDVKDIIAEKESALAAADVIQLFDIPKYTNVLNGIIHVETAFNSTTCTGDFGSDLDVDQWIDGQDMTTTGVGTPLGAAEYFAAANTLDLVLVTLTGTLTVGVFTAIAICQDLSL